MPEHIYLLERALRYIEQHLKATMTLEDIAFAANYSPWHFHRLFLAFTGVTVGEYVRKRRLSEASRELALGSKAIKQLAAEYQFESQAAFTRSFKSFSGCTPGEMRRHLRPLLNYQARITLQGKGETMLNPTFKTKPAFRVIGKTCQSTMKNNTIPALWGTFGTYCDSIPGTIHSRTALGICYFEDCGEMTDETPFTYLAGMEVNPGQAVPEGMVARDVPTAEYAVFEHHGSLENLHNTYNAIYGQWMPHSGYERSQVDDFEVYDERFKFGEPDSIMEIWVPVSKKN